MKNIRLARRLSFVPRWSVIPTIRRQTVAEHCFQSARIAEVLLDMHLTHDHDMFRLNVIKSCLDHDDDEAIYGDLPSTSKKRASPLEASPVKIVVKCADYLEAILFIHEEQAMGNQFGMEEVRMWLFAAFAEWWDLFPVAGPNKPPASDVIRSFTQETVPSKHVHPSMDQA